MKKKWKLALLAGNLLLVSMLCSCSVLKMVDDLTKEENVYQVQNTTGNEGENASSSKIGIKEKIEKELRGKDETEAVVETVDTLLLEEPLIANLGGDFAYRQLREDDQKLYEAMLNVLLRGEVEVEIPTVNPDVIDQVFNCVMLDHPELFYVDGYTYTKYSVKDEIKSIDFSGNYIMSKEEVEEIVPVLYGKVASIEAQAPKYSDYELVKYLYDTIILSTEYDLSSENNQNILSVFIGHTSVCQGYAKALQYVLLDLGRECVLVTGTVNGGEGHAWNLVKMDGSYYHVDPTWGDASYTTEVESENNVVPEINYDYLGVTTAQITKSHTIQSCITIPFCDSLQDNYYIQEGAYFYDVNTEQLSAVFEKGYENQNQCITLKCNSNSTFLEMKQYLLEDTHIFEYLQGEADKISYTVNENLESISFWLY